ncbi:16S rRNA (guanine(966)-N(2))-methyltransferase RsmD [Bacillus alkalicellulosilyticus]|uniref:16S rRNA (guanine(966)-N(2))-methyltransferase RsmD n=1 Tax=Alkalihalobacterium alkalicellulosilyticum TaxID=1912214 RepID=UPI000996A486|nr:16S rRNA (guanine(966)-N(2))-methyltransferase RsmD [Bacillus alkalicellulosilyticus]
MRVISGERKGLPLKAVPGTATRPTTDKVKEAIFSMIGPYFDGGLALDLYGGSGGLGIEAMSRGMEKVIFVDQNKKAIEVIHENLRKCHYEEKAEVFRNDAFRALKALTKRDIRFSHIFLDPPYAKQQLEKEMTYITKERLLEDKGIILAEHGSSVILPEEILSLRLIRRETYGDTTISIYQEEGGRNE